MNLFFWTCIFLDKNFLKTANMTSYTHIILWLQCYSTTVYRPIMLRRAWRQSVRRYSSVIGGKVGPLDGVRVIDMTRVAAGPYCAMILADMGADVIKVERPIVGDDSRRYGPPFVDVRAGARDDRLSLYFVSLNRNKRSVCVDFRHPDGRTIVRDMVRESDVLIENYIPGTLDK